MGAAAAGGIGARNVSAEEFHSGGNMRGPGYILVRMGNRQSRVGQLVVTDMK